MPTLRKVNSNDGQELLIHAEMNSEDPNVEEEDKDLVDEYQKFKKQYKVDRNSAKAMTVKKSDRPFQTFNYLPIPVRCFNCQHVADTKVTYNFSYAVWLLAMVLFSLGCVCGCYFIPFCMRSLRNYEHKCRKCETLLAHNYYNK